MDNPELAKIVAEMLASLSLTERRKLFTVLAQCFEITPGSVQTSILPHWKDGRMYPVYCKDLERQKRTYLDRFAVFLYAFGVSEGASIINSLRSQEVSFSYPPRDKGIKNKIEQYRGKQSERIDEIESPKYCEYTEALIPFFGDFNRVFLSSDRKGRIEMLTGIEQLIVRYEGQK